ncbi:MAG TPA: hypothetical protein VLA09_03325 [Longimicrobiales bacterium]|nr:hypothetical protein [Longimicrobiales bacterium]
MSDQVVILHGWSDKSDSFENLARYLKGAGFRTVPIFLGDYVSLRNDVKIDDVAKRMEEVIAERMALPKSSPRRLGPAFHLIVHSTGGLVARRWISRYYAGRACPVQNFVMLAPANFGSKLAHRGRSIGGRLLKGLKTGLETGDEMLYALELSSPFQWELARDDLFSHSGANGRAVFYSGDKVRPFTIVGTHPYQSLAASLLNENGSDGTVRVAAANLDARGITIDFTGGRLENPKKTPWKRRGGEVPFPLAVLPDRDHGSIVHPDEPGYSRDPEAQARLGELICQALQVRSAQEYGRIAVEWAQLSHESTRGYAGSSRDAQGVRNRFFRKQGVSGQYFHEHYQLHVRAIDEFGEPIPDYFVTFMPETKKKKMFGLRDSFTAESLFFHEEVLADVHRHRREPANLCMYLDRYDLMRADGFYARLRPHQAAKVAFTVTAADPGERVSYFTRSRTGRRGIIGLHGKDSKDNRWLKRHRTHFVELIIPRIGREDLFELRRG